MQAELHDKLWKISQYFKNGKTLYGCQPHKNITETKPWDAVHMDLIGQYSNSIRQYQTGGTSIKNNLSFIYMMMIEPAAGWFETSEVPTYDLDKVRGRNDDYIDNSSVRVSQFFNNMYIYADNHVYKY